MPESRQRLTIYSAQGGTEPEKPPHVDWQCIPVPHTVRRRLTRGERLLRDSAIACALLFGVLALKNIDQPWAQAASGGVERALTASIDLDETLGSLSFVRNLVPDSALVFWNLNAADQLKQPVAGTLLHDYAEAQPWYEFRAAEGEAVVAGRTGELTRRAQTDAGDWVLELTHEDGARTVYAFVDQGEAEIGDTVQAGEVLCHSGTQGSVYLEYQRDGQPCPVGGFVP